MHKIHGGDTTDPLTELLAKKHGKKFAKRNVVNDISRRWTDATVPYSIDNALFDEEE